jgi:3-deoxy-manno-octulosonate cytidylyltransferase (CMP-KDO synthetase)
MALLVNPVVIIPARLASTRLPDKPLADIAGKPMIVHVLERAREADVGPVVVACGDAEIAEAVRIAGGDAVMTRPDHPSGSDRIFEALNAIDGDRFDMVVNLQGDVPVIEPAAIRSILDPFADPVVDIVTLVTKLANQVGRADPNVVKAQVQFAPGERFGRAHNFSRDPEQLEDPLFHHIGMYAYRREALERFVALPPAKRELRDKLEQLRALDAGMRIATVRVDGVPIEVNTLADLERVRAHVSAHRTPFQVQP